jgi:biopolymer transport protein ExbD
MKINLHSSNEEVQIQIIPLIDVIFCILTFFLLAAVQFSRQQAINVDLPKANTGTSSNIKTARQQGQILPVTIDAIGQTYVEKQPVKREELTEILKKYVQENPSGVLVLNASRTSSYNDVIETLDILRQVGGDRVSLGIIPGSPSPTTNTPANLPVNPAAVPAPNIAPPSGIKEEGNFNLNPQTPNLAPLPGAPAQPQTGQGISPGINPAPAVPGLPVPVPNIAPQAVPPSGGNNSGQNNSVPKR